MLMGCLQLVKELMDCAFRYLLPLLGGKPSSEEVLSKISTQASQNTPWSMPRAEQGTPQGGQGMWREF